MRVMFASSHKIVALVQSDAILFDLKANDFKFRTMPLSLDVDALLALSEVFRTSLVGVACLEL